MLLTPKKRKHRKQFRPNIKGAACRGTTVAFGEFGLKATTSGVITNKQIEAARKVIVRYTRKMGRVWIRFFPDTPITKRGLEMPMGSGKSDVDGYGVPIRKGRVLFEVSGLEKSLVEKIFTSAAKKLPVKARMVTKGEVR